MRPMPREAEQPLLNWFRQNARVLPWREEPSPYRVWVSEIMLQQTRVEAVRPYFARFMEALPDIPALAEVPEETLFKLWEGLGYYSRARNLRRAAREVMERFGGALPASRDALLTLPGIGSYTAGAIASIAFGIPAPAVDGNVLRVYSRLTACGDSMASAQIKKRVETEVFAAIPVEQAGAYNQALMELGATVCLPNGQPKCGECPLAFLCEAHSRGVEAAYPAKREKKPRRVEERTVFLLVCGGEAALRKRPDSGLLAGLWEFPNLEGFCTEEGAAEATRQWGAEPLAVKPLPSAKHIFTHVEWHMRGWWIDVDSIPAGCLAAGRVSLAAEYAVPSAFRAYLDCFMK